MSNSESSSEEDHFQDTFVQPKQSVTPSKSSVSFQSQQELLDYYKSSPSQNTRSSHIELFQSRLTSTSVNMTEQKPPPAKVQMPPLADPKPLRIPIMVNPLEEFFNPDPTQEEIDVDVEEPFKLNKNSTPDERTIIRHVHRINRLKKDRTNIYSSITKMTKTIVRVMNGRDERAWIELEAKASRSTETLWDITRELHDAGIAISDEEDEKFNRYSALLESHIAKIRAHIRSQATGIPNLILATEKAFKPEPEQRGDGMNAYLGADEEEQDQDQGQAGLPDQLMKTFIKMFDKMAAAKPKKPESDYRSLKPVEIPNFTGDTTKYHYFKEAFKAAHDWRKLDNKMLALQLQSYLKGPALKLAQDRLKDQITETSYEEIWEELENRYGGSFNEDASISEQFNRLPVLRSFNCKDLEKTYDAFKIQANYYHRYDPHSLHNTRCMLNKMAKEKLSVELGTIYVIWCTEKRLPQSFASMLEWLKVRYEASQVGEREFNHSKDERQTDRYRARINATRDQNSNVSDNEESQNDNGNNSDSDSQTITFEPRDKTFWVNPKSGGKPYPWNGKTSFPKKNFDPTKTVRFDTRPAREPLQLKPTETCILCNVRHEMSECPKFKVLSLKEKKLIVRSSVLCFHCLSNKHFLKDCTTKKGQLCGVKNCKFYHHPLIHAEKIRFNVEYTIQDMESLTGEEFDSISYLFCETESINHIAQKGSISLQTVVCNVTSGNNYVKTVALLDTGSTMTAIDEDFAFNNNLKIIGKRDGQEVYVIDRLVKMKGFQYQVELTVSSVDKDTSTQIEAWTIKNLVQNCGIVDWSERKNDFPHLRQINFPQLPENPKITILFGCNVTRMFKSTKTIADEDNQGGPIAMRTFLGWTCVGNSANQTQLNKDPTSELINVFLKSREEN